LSAGDAGGLPFYTMPYVNGMSLRARMNDGPVPLDAAISILRDIALALEYAHDHGIIHRDIKPENVLLSGRTAVVADFGIAKALVAAGTGSHERLERGSASDLRTLTQVGVSLGTPAYMAPEQAVGDAVDHRADLYAWGVIAYELLAGEHPFAGQTTAGGLVAAHIRDTPPPLATRAPAVPPAVSSIVDRALTKDPVRRPPSARAIVQALDTPGRSVDVRHPWWRRRVVVAALVVAALAGAAALQRWATSGSGRARGGRASARSVAVAVLPFANQSADTSDAYFAEGMSDELTTALGKLSAIRVASRSSASRFRDSTAIAAARALNVTAVLEGKVRRFGDNLHVSAVLTSATDGTEIWSQNFDRRVADVFEVQGEIARAIVDSLRVTLTGQAPEAPTVWLGPRDLVAYNLYLKGRYAWSRRGRDLLSAVDLYRQAIARDSTFARAYAALAMAYTPMMVYGVARGDSVLPLAEASALRALQLDSTLAEAHLALASVRKMQWRWADAEREFSAAIRFGPSDATAHQWYGTLLYSLGSVDEAVGHLERARDLDPVSAAVGTDVAYGLYAAHRFDDALKEGLRTVSLDTTLAISHWLTGLALLQLGRPDTALVAFTTARRLGDTPDARPVLVRTFRALGRPGDADTTYAALARSYRAGKGVDRDMAIAAAAAGEVDMALEAVRRAIARRDPIVTEYSLPCDPLLDPLKKRAEFTRMLTSVGMKVCPPA